MPTHSELVLDYFRSKALQLLAASDEAVCEHSGLKGSHREELIRIFLRHILPSRFSADHGMVYGPDHRSREADVVIWDSDSYPRLQMHGHSLFFAESVRAILEVKTRWSDDEWNDVRMKTEAVRSIAISEGPGLTEELALLKLRIDTLKPGAANLAVNHKIHLRQHRIGANAVFLHGGDSLADNAPPQELVDKADDTWPDALLLLERGVLVRKEYDAAGGRLRFLEAGNDALFAFTEALNGQIIERSVYVQDPLYLRKYVEGAAKLDVIREVTFPLLHPVPGIMQIWDEV